MKHETCEAFFSIVSFTAFINKCLRRTMNTQRLDKIVNKELDTSQTEKKELFYFLHSFYKC